MNLFCLEHLLITISCFSLAIFIAKHAENTAHRIWSIFNLQRSIMVFGITIWQAQSKMPEQAIFYWRISELLAILFLYFSTISFIHILKSIVNLFFSSFTARHYLFYTMPFLYPICYS